MSVRRKSENTRILSINGGRAKDTCRLATEISRKARDGEIVGIVGIVEYRDGTYGKFSCSTLSRLQRSGALLEYAIEGLQGE